MHARPSLQLKQSQSLVMTQALQQSIKLLQMNSLELREFLDAEIEKNPFLEMEESEPTGEVEERLDELSPDDQPMDADSDDAEPPAVEETSEWQGEEEWSYDPAERISITARDKDGDALDSQENEAKAVSLQEHLAAQALLELHAAVERHIALHLIDLVNEAGYITEDLSQLADQLGAGKQEIEKVLSVLQQCEPAGICARNLSECLSLQLKEKNRLDPAMQALLANLPLLASGDLAQLKRKCGVDDEDLRQMIAEIRALQPKPGLAFQHEITQTAEPDVLMRRDNKGKWHIELNSATLPRLLVNQRYYSTVSMKASGADKKYLSEQMNTASWLIKALDQRAQTLLKVATEIITQQDSFFRLGIHHLKPLTLKDIAAATGYHESTVSRVTTGKYLMSPRGLFELKYFFTSGVSHGAGGEDVSSETVKHVIKELIDREESGNILSDDDLTERLKARNINVARRTVAKYREAMGIPSSTQRRRMRLVSY